MAKKIKSGDKILNGTIGYGLAQMETLATKLRRRLFNRLRKKHKTVNATELLLIARDELALFAPIYAQMLLDSQLASWIRGLEVVSSKTPKWMFNAIRQGVVKKNQSKMKPDDVTFVNILSGVIEDEADQFVEYPTLSARVAELVNKNVMKKPEFQQVSKEVAQRAFTVAHVNSKAKLEEIQREIAMSFTEGKTQTDLAPNDDETVAKAWASEFAAALRKDHVVRRPLRVILCREDCVTNEIVSVR